jgi:hypothetical protein
VKKLNGIVAEMDTLEVVGVIKKDLTHNREGVPYGGLGILVDGQKCGFYIIYDALCWEASGSLQEAVDRLNGYSPTGEA